ncbi:MAG: YggS family pyridoxal phosphate-dependent enzyme [Anaerolineae bacterium]|nr:YggS family pyridoxal phosphate-dependent enzyme [Anaerolineae bacterium]
MNHLVKTIQENLAKVQEQVSVAAQSAGRRSEEVKIVVVTKGQPLETIQAAIFAGAKILGENYPEEAYSKMMRLERHEEIEWHMIGHLQTRKAKIVVENFDFMHSLDSIRLAEKLNRLCEEKGRKLPVLLECNVGGEESKGGWMAHEERLWSDLLPVVETCLGFNNLEIHGLMAMPPWDENPEHTRPYFVMLKKLQDFLSRNFPSVDFSELSMGTSVDFNVAVQEGATYVRIGEAIVGSRQKNLSNLSA